jgi:hypothetical protein
MSYERDIRQLIDQMQRQQGNMIPQNPQGGMGQQPGLPPNMGGTDQSPHLIQNQPMAESPDQSPVNPINSVRPMGSPIGNKKPTPAGLNTTKDGCPQCGMVHPPLPPGKKCPMAPLKVKEGEKEKIVDVAKFLGEMHNIILSQCEIKKIKDVEKLFQNIIIEITKYLEEYSE